MTRRENILLYILIFLFFGCLFFLACNYSVSKFKENEGLIIKYKSMLEKLESQKNLKVSTLNESKSSSSEVLTVSTSEITDMILEKLRLSGIIPTKYQISSSKDSDYIEISIRCSNIQITNYLASFSTEIYPYYISSLNIKTEPENISATIRYNIQNTEIKAEETSITKLQIAKLFRPEYKPKPIIPTIIEETVTDAPEEKNPETNETIENGTSKYKIIGNIKDSDGINYLYLKNINSNRVYKILPENIFENSESKYILKIDDKKIQIDKR